MIGFQRVNLSQKDQYEAILMAEQARGCEYSFANVYLWGLQSLAFLQDCVLRFSHFHGKSVYPYPIGTGDKHAAITEILRDAEERGIPCRIIGITERDKEELEQLFPGTFYIKAERDSFDYVYDINDLADLRGRKFQSKRNHFNRFCADHPDHQAVPMTCDMLPKAKAFIENWYARRRETDPEGDYLLESVALGRLFNHCGELDMEGLVLMDGEEILAITMGSRLSPDTFDIHFEKAREDVSGAYNAINCHFARYLRLKYPDVQFLNREEDMGLEGLRTAKLSYRPHHMVEKYRAVVKEDIHVD
ncbi:MAG: DUF2156 domain-containing protein [Oscillospiraceae bacterium]|nr:DUF2156 domain-containing protein [Oscillospiraceae bacterium]